MTNTRHLLALTAEELMSRDVITISVETSVRSAAHRLMQLNVGGAPVLDSLGRCVGVLSRSDLVRFLDQSSVPPADPHDPDGCFGEWQILELEDLPPDDVGHFMTRTVITASPTTRVAELARIMCREHIHRVMITDDSRRLIGIVTSMDILAALADQVDNPHE
jgi:CBS-domain-containing membrane protein